MSGWGKGGPYTNADIFFECAWLGCTAKRSKNTSLCTHHTNVKAGQIEEGATGYRKSIPKSEHAAIRLRMSRFESPRKIAAEYGVGTPAILRISKHKPS